MTVSQPAPVTLHADQEHSGIRVVLFIALFVGLFLSFRLLALVLDAAATSSWVDYVTFLSCIGSFPLALLFIWGLEKLLKRVWHSGLSLSLDDRGITVNDRRIGAEREAAGEPVVVWSIPVNQIRWHFQLKGYPRGGRERRVSADWLCLAAELQQDDNRLSVFAFMPPKSAAAWTENPKEGFHLINPADLYEKSVRSRIGPPTRPQIASHLLQTKDARYWLAERRRWEKGIELTPDDFRTLITWVEQYGESDTQTNPI